jgi:hypothetical protein
LIPEYSLVVANIFEDSIVWNEALRYEIVKKWGFDFIT